MGKVVKDIVEQTFTKRNTNTYELSILVGMGSFDYVIVDSQQHVQVLKSYTLDEQSPVSDLEHILGLDPLPKYRFRNVRIAWSGGKSTLLPKRLYQQAEQRAILEQTTPVLPTENIRIDGLLSDEIKNIFAIPQELESFLNTTFPGHRLWHLGSILIEGQRKLSVQYQGPQVYIHLVGSLVYISVFNHMDLVFYNSFPYKSAKDFVFYLLLAFKQHDLSQQDTPVHITGQLVEDSEIFRLLKRYINKTNFQPPPAFLHYGPKLEGQTNHLYFGVLSLSITA